MSVHLNVRTSQRIHVQNHAYANKSRHTYVRDVRQLSNPEPAQILTLFKITNTFLFCP